MTGSPLRRVLLVGFMGAGKTSVGRAVAASLGWPFADVDQVVEEAVGATVAEIFALRGEAAFRELEDHAAQSLLGRERIVLASGGGWGAAAGRLRDLPEGTACFWLRVSPAEALRRAAAEPDRRPLLDVEDPLREATQLLESRSPHYGDARWAVDTDGSSVEDVSARILEILAAKYPKTGPE